MRYVVIGAGAIGGVVGGRLADAGREVLLVARGAHGEAIRERGLEVWLPDRDLRLRIPSVARVGDLALRADDVLLLAVKSQQTAAVLNDLEALAVDGQPVPAVLPLFCLQNGVANEDAALRVVRSVHGVVVNLPATHLEPGIVIGEGAPVGGVLDLGLAVGGTDALDARVAADFTAAGFLAEPRPDVLAWKRAKLLANLGNALDALAGGELSSDEGAAFERLADAARAEGVAAFAAAGLPVTDAATQRARLDGRYEALEVHGRAREGGSTWQSVTRGTGSVETDYLNGEIARLGRQTGTPTPVNELLQTAMWRLLQRGGAAGSVPPSTLEQELHTHAG